MINELLESGREPGLDMNMGKTKIIREVGYEEIEIDQRVIEQTDEIIYLRQRVALKNRMEEEIKRRIKLAWRKFWSLKHILEGKYSNKTKIEILNSCVLRTLTYGAQTWSATKRMEEKIRTTNNVMLRSIAGVKLRDKIKIAKLKEKFTKIRKIPA